MDNFFTAVFSDPGGGCVAVGIFERASGAWEYVEEAFDEGALVNEPKASVRVSNLNLAEASAKFSAASYDLNAAGLKLVASKSSRDDLSADLREMIGADDATFN